FDPQLSRIDYQPQVPVIGIVISLEHDLVVVRCSRLNDLRYTQRYASRSVQLLHIVTAIAAYEVGNFGRVRSVPSEALVRVRVTGEHGVRPYAGLGADRVHLLPH